jgi:mono/diheme cytochrome c family protein
MRNSFRVGLVLMALLLAGVATVSARSVQKSTDDVVIGAQLYDRWYAALGVNAPDGNMPIWERQTANTRSGADTWRCSECHGWDYKGSEGAYSSGSHYTGFANVMKLAAAMTPEEIVSHLKGSKDPSHDFSKYIDDANLQKLALFLKEGVIDDTEFIDAITLKVKNGDTAHGKQLYDQTCATCHGADGTQIVFRTEGINEYLGSVANRDPFRFLHRSRFGVAGTEMPVGRDLGWTPADGRDVLAYAQTLPTGQQSTQAGNAGAGSAPSPKLGGPGNNIFSGMLTGLAAFFGMFGLSVLFLGGLVVLGVVIVWALRKR